jgi:hypothetical protein
MMEMMKTMKRMVMMDDLDGALMMNIKIVMMKKIMEVMMMRVAAATIS